VDLQARYTIKKVEVVNRGDCCCKLILFIKCRVTLYLTKMHGMDLVFD
jgi:hypothetical protein